MRGRADALARLAYAARTKTEAGDSFWAMLDDALAEDGVSDADAASAGGLSAATVAPPQGPTPQGGQAVTVAKPAAAATTAELVAELAREVGTIDKDESGQFGSFRSVGRVMSEVGTQMARLGLSLSSTVEVHHVSVSLIAATYSFAWESRFGQLPAGSMLGRRLSAEARYGDDDDGGDGVLRLAARRCRALWLSRLRMSQRATRSTVTTRPSRSLERPLRDFGAARLRARSLRSQPTTAHECVRR